MHTQPMFLEVMGSRLEVQRITPAPAQPGMVPGADRPTLVFLHEGLGSVSMWRDWPARLCAQAHCPGLVYSRQGYGRSSPRREARGPTRNVGEEALGRLPTDYMHREAWEVLPRLLQQLGVQRPVLVGHSDGGTIALLYASRHPVAACVVLAPHVIVEDISVQAITQARDAFQAGGVASPLRQGLQRHHADVDGAFWQWNDVWLSSAFRSFDIRPDCQRIQAPLLCIQGEDDPYGTMRQIDDIAPAGPKQVFKLARCGHAPHKDQRLAVDAAILALLQDLPA